MNGWDLPADKQEYFEILENMENDDTQDVWDSGVSLMGWNEGAMPEPKEPEVSQIWRERYKSLRALDEL